MNGSGTHLPSRWPLILTAVGCLFGYFVMTGAFSRGEQAVDLWVIWPFFAFAVVSSALPVFLNYVQTGPVEVVIRNYFATRRIPTGDVLSLGIKHGNKGQYLEIKYRAGEKTVAYKFWNYYGRPDVFEIVQEIRMYNPSVVLDKDLTYFMEKVNEARLQGKPLTFIGYSKPALSAEDVRKFWWIPFIAMALVWLLLQAGVFD